MLMFAALPDRALPIGSAPIAVAVGRVDQDAWPDLVSLGTDGRLTVAINGGDGGWSRLVISDLGLDAGGTAHGLALGLIDGDELLDAVVQHDAGITVARGDGTGRFAPLASWRSGDAGAFVPSDAARVGLAVTLVNADFAADVIAVLPGSNEVLVFWGGNEGSGGTAGPLAAPVRYASGANEPVDVIAGQFLGSPWPDLAVAHRDGTVTFLVGMGDGMFQLQPAATVVGLGVIQALAAGDFDADGDLDVAVSGGDRVTVLWQDDDPLPASPIRNGDFAAGLTGWTIRTEADGWASDTAVESRVSALGGMAQLWEHDAFLTSLQQTFTVPPSPQTISFDVVALGLEPAVAGSLPDAFEVSLWNEAGQSLVPTFRPDASSFFNANPEGAVAWAAGVAWDGRQVTLDISALTPGTQATLAFDLIGNPPGQGSVVAVDNVRIAPDSVTSYSFTPALVWGGFQAGTGIAAGDVDGDGHTDLVVADAAADRVVMFRGDGAGAFSRYEWDVGSYGHGPRAVALGPLTPDDAVWDAAIGLGLDTRVLTPLRFDQLLPQVTLVQPAPSQIATAAVTQIELRFSEAMQDAGPAGEHSVTNLAAYRLTSDDGDDEWIPLDVVSYDAATHEAVISLCGALPDGSYALRVLGSDARYAPVNINGQPLADGADVVFYFTVNAAGPIDVQAADVTGSEGQPISLAVTFRNPGSPGPHTATIDWGDGSVETVVVPPIGSIAVIGPISPIEPIGQIGPILHVYPDNGHYTIRVALADDSLALPPATIAVAARIANTPPTLTVPVGTGPAGTVRHTGLDVSLQVGTFSDPGFSNPAAGTVETFTATIDWGDATAAAAGNVTAVAGSIGSFTTGTIDGSHQYAAAGTYQVSVTVADDDGGTDVQSFTLEVQAVQTTRFYVVDRKRRATFLYDAQFVAAGMWPLARTNAAPRGVAATPAGDMLWVVNASKDVFAYDAGGTALGAWRATDVRQPQGIATDGRHLWIVDDATDRLYFYADAADRRSGKWTATSSFRLHKDNRKPSGLATDGNLLWVTDARCHKPRVFVYALDGRLVGSWTLDPANGHPRGIALQRSTGDLWIADRHDVLVYRYAEAAARTSGSSRAAQTYKLAGTNRTPEGISDPATQIQIGDTVSEAISEAGEEDEFLFDVPEGGQAIFVDFQLLTGGGLQTRLLGPGGGTVYSTAAVTAGGLDRGPLHLDAGTYTLSVQAFGTGTRTYRFQLWDVPATPVYDIQIGVVNSGSVPSPGAAERWQFDAIAGQAIYVDFRSLGGGSPILETRLRDPAGGTVYTQIDFADDRQDRGPLTLVYNGTYTLEGNGRGDQTGGYAFQIWDVPPDREQWIPRNTPIRGETASPVDRVRYRFDATAGEQFLIDVIDNPQQVYFDLVRPSGSFVFQRQTGDQLPAALSESGTYTLVASSYKPVTGVISERFGEFQFQVQQVAAPAVGVPDSRGTDFWLAFTRHARDVLGAKDVELVLQITSPVDTSGTVMLPGAGIPGSTPWMTSFVVRAGQVTRIVLPATAEIAGSDQVESRGVRVRALDEVTVYALSYLPYSSDGYLALPRDTFGTEYLVVSYDEGNALTGRTSSFALVAAEDGTNVTVTLPVAVGSRVAGEPYSIQLNAGQVYELTADTVADLTGTAILADKPIGVYGGHRSARIPAGYSAANYLVEQLPPIDMWGRHFVTVPLATRTGGDRFRIVAARAGTEIHVDGMPVATLDRGQFYETVLVQPAEINASQPVVVAQFAQGYGYDNGFGDPTLLLVPPVEQFLDRYTLAVPLTGFDVNFINIAAPAAAVGAILLDGAVIPAAEFTLIGASGYYAVQLPVSPGAHRLEASSDLRPPTTVALPTSDFRPPTSAPFSVSVYGFADADAYGYLGGQAFGRINAVANFELTPKSASQPVGAQQPFVATLTDGDSQPLAGVRVDFAVVGTHAGNGFAFTDGLGRAVFALTGSQPGGDVVTASVGAWSEVAAASWIAAAPAIVVTAPAPDSRLRAGSYTALTGRATPGSPHAPIVAVTVNGRPVDMLDAAGNFFALVHVESGVMTLSVEATDVFGQSATAGLTLIGVDESTREFAFEQAYDTTAAGRLTYEGTFFNRRTQTLHAALRLTNTGDAPLRAAVLAVFDQISPLTVTLSASEGTTPEYPLVVPPSDGNGLPPEKQPDPIDPNLPPQKQPNPGKPNPKDPPAPAASDPLPINLQVPSDRPYVTFDAPTFDGDAALGLGLANPPGVLSPAETSLPIAVRFGNPSRVRFEFAVTLLAVGNHPPEFDSPPVIEAAAGRPYRYAAVASDVDGDVLTYRLAAGPDFLGVDPYTGLVSGTPVANDVGAHQVELIADDGYGGTGRQTFSLQVWAAIPNRPPLFQTIPDVQVEPGTDYTYAARAEDPDGDALQYTLDAAPAGMTVHEATGVVWYPQAVAGAHAVSLRVADGRGGTAQQTFILTVGDGTPNAAPQFISSPPVRGVAGELYQYEAIVADPDGGPPQFSLTQAPTGMIVDAATGLVRWQPAAGQTGFQAVTLRVTDQRGGAAVQQWAIDVTSTAINRPPSFVGQAATLFLTQDVPFTHLVQAQDPEGGNLRYELVSAPTGMNLSPLPPDASQEDGILLTWSPAAADLGWHRVVVRARDPLDAFAQQTFHVEVRRPNTPPRFTTEPLTTGTAGAVYRHRAAAEDDEDAVTFGIVQGPPDLSIDAASGLLFWRSTPADAGLHAVTVRATDERGLWTDQPFTLQMLPDAEGPAVRISFSDDLICLPNGTGSDQNDWCPSQSANITSTVIVQVHAVDNVALAGVTLSLNGTLLPPDAWWRYEFAPPGPGLFSFTATATDTAGNVGTATRALRVFDPADTTPPVVEITSPVGGDVITYLTDVIGTVTDENLELYRLQYALAGTEQWTTFHDSAVARGTPFLDGGAIDSGVIGGVIDGLLGVFDPTLLQRDNYDLRVVAQDINGLTTIVQLGLPISVEAQAVLGNFRLDFTDLSIPLAGIPIQIRRTYDTLNAARSGDFGYGWTLGIAQASLRESVRVTEAERSGITAIFGAAPFRPGTRVYLTTPAGRRVGFTFDPIAEAAVLGTIWRPRFIADPGVYDQLTVADLPLSQRADGTFAHYPVNLPYNPAQYSLTTKDGLTYRYDQFTGLQDVTDRNQNVLTYTADGITSSTGVSIRFHRDAQGRITAIEDPDGNTLRYTYDAAGDLVGVEDQVGNRSTYGYLASPPHYLTTNSCPSGVCIASTAYDAAGRLVSLTDSLGHSATRQFDVLNNLEIVGDLLGNETTILFDPRGNVLAATDPLGHTTWNEYDARDNPVSQTDARGYVTLTGYDDRGNLTSLTDAMGNTWQRTYDEQNLLLDETDPQGNRTQLRYDGGGNLIAVTDALGYETQYERDLVGRVVTVTDSNQHAIFFAYRTSAESQPTQVTFADGSTLLTEYNAWGQPTRTVNGRRHEFVFRYDAAGKLVETRDPLGGTVRMEYSGDQLIRLVDPRGQEMRYEYDAVGRLARMTDAKGETTRYAYDANGRMVEQTDPLGRVTRYGYRADGRLESQTDPLGTVTTYDYDAVGNPTTITETPPRPVAAAGPHNFNGLEPTDPSESLLSNSAADGLGGWVDERVARRISFRYDALNRAIERVNSLEQSQWFAWDEVGRLTAWTDENGYLTAFVYDRVGRLLETIDALGSVETRTYDGRGNLLSITDRRAGVTRFRYDARDRLVERQDALGAIFRWEYDAVGNVVAEVDENGRAERFAYDALNRLVEQTDARNGSRVYSYDEIGNLLVWTNARGSGMHYGYDELNRLTSITDALGGVRRFEYDAVGNAVALTDANGQTLQLTYDSLNRPVRRTDPLGGTEHFDYDAFGNLQTWTDARGNATRYAYDAMDQQVSITDALGGVTRFGYDPAGNLTALTDANGHTTAYAYDALHRLVRRTDALGGVRALTYDAVGNVASQQNENGHVTRYQYDALHRLVTLTDALGGNIAWIYDAVGNPLAVTDANGHTTRYEYDELHRLVRQLDPLGFVQQLGYDEAGNVISATDELGYATTYAYDALQRLTSVTDAVGLVAAYAYDAAGNLTAARDGLQRTTTYAYDGSGRLISVTDPRDAVTSFTYDAVGNRLSVTDPSEQTTRYAYDSLNRLITATDPLGHDRLYAYDPVGNLTRYTDRNGRVRTFEYDALDRGISEDWWQADERVRRLQFSYDAVGNLTGASDADSTYGFSYDVLDRMTQADNAGTPRAPHLVLNYIYDPVGNVLSVRDNSGVSVTSAYDARDLLTSRTWQGSQIDPARVEFASSARGELTEIQRFRDAQGLQALGRSAFAYDARGRLAELAHRNAVDTALAEYDYTFDLADQLIRYIHHGRLSEYSYDPAGQLTDANHSGQDDEAYAYDANGNRSGDTYVTGPDHQVLADAAYDYDYDAEGNLVRKTERATGVGSHYTYDHRNRLIRFEQRSAGGILLAEAEYVYDVFDRRIVKSVDPDGAGPASRQEMRFVYDGLNVWADFDVLDQVIARYLYAEGLDNLLARWRPSDGTAWYLTDHLGTIRDLVDAAGVIINQLDYDSFGRLVSQTNPTAGDRFGFTSREYDPELGLYYYRARYYDPHLGRFVSQDPLGFDAGDSNLYRYVGNAPLAARDPLGLAGEALFYGLMARRAPMAAGAAVGGVLGFACGWVEGFTEATVSSTDADSDAALAMAWERAITYAAIGTALGGTLTALPAVVQFYGGGILMGVAAGLIIGRAPEDPWQVTAVRVGCLVISAAVGSPAQRWMTGQIGRLPFMGPRSPNGLASPKPPIPRGRPSRPSEPHPATKPPSSKGVLEPAPSRPAGPLRQRLFRFMEEPAGGRTQRLSQRTPIGSAYPATLSQRLAAYKHWKGATGVTGTPTQPNFRRFVGAHRPNSRGSTLYNEDGGFAAWSEGVSSTHGNTAGSQTAWLYRLENDADGVLKWGVSQDPFTRYPRAFMRDKVIIPLEIGPRRTILAVERDLVERLPGPLNFEPWAGSRAGE